jgi:hypothetical protein
LAAVEYGYYPVPISFLHTVRLLASIARQEVDHLDTLAEDERDAGSEESGVESLHMSSDGPDPEERIERRRERHRDSAVEPAVEHVHESAFRQLPYDPLPVRAADTIPFDAEAAAVLTDAKVYSVHKGCGVQGATRTARSSTVVYFKLLSCL